MNTKTTNKNTDDLVAQINDLTEKAKKVNQGIAGDNKASDAWMSDLKGRVDENIGTLDDIYADLDSAKKEADAKLDDISARESKDLENDEDLGE